MCNNMSVWMDSIRVDLKELIKEDGKSFIKPIVSEIVTSFFRVGKYSLPVTLSRVTNKAFSTIFFSSFELSHVLHGYFFQLVSFLFYLIPPVALHKLDISLTDSPSANSS